MQTETAATMPTSSVTIGQVVTSMLDAFKDWLRAFGERGVARRDTHVVVTEVHPSTASHDVLAAYLGAIPFTNGDGWEVLR